MSLPRLRFFTKPDCELCEHALEVVESVRRRVAFELEQIDITADPDLFQRYRYRIPVIEIDGEAAFELTVREDRLLARLRRR
ncbi:MAG TPA: glutaredoxin family protein [Bacillota bacterium]